MSATRRQRQQERLVAFEAVVTAYEAPLLRYAGRLVSDANAAQDIVQNTFLRLFRNWQDEMAPSPQLSGWLYRVAHNCAVDHLRRETRRERAHQRHADGCEETAPPDRGPGAGLSEAAEQAAAALRVLSLRERQLVLLKVYEEKSYREISEITGLTVSNVGYILHHAMRKLAAAMEATGSAR